MSRSGYSYDCENLGLWRQAVDRAMKGKRGQAFFKELAEALDAMPNKRLIAGELISSDGECCTIGVICQRRQLDISKIDYYDAGEVGALVGISRALAAEIEYLNDDQYYAEEPEERWKRMRKWVADNLLPENILNREAREL